MVSFGFLLSSTFVFHKLNVVENRSDFSVTVGRGAREEQVMIRIIKEKNVLCFN